MNVEDIISSGLLEMYALGNTSAEENAQVQELVAAHPAVRDELNKIEEALEQYAFSNAIQPKIKVQEKLFSQLNFTQNNSTNKVENNSVFNIANWKKLAVAASLLFAASALFNIFIYKKYADSTTELQAKNQKIESLRELEEEDEQEKKVVFSKYSLPLKMNGSELAPNADAKIFWLTNTGEIFLDGRNLPPTPAGKQYQLWAIVNGKAEDAGLIQSADGHTFKLQKMKTFGKAQAFAITLEVSGGVVASKEKPFAIVKL